MVLMKGHRPHTRRHRSLLAIGSALLLMSLGAQAPGASAAGVDDVVRTLCTTGHDGPRCDPSRLQDVTIGRPVPPVSLRRPSSRVGRICGGSHESPRCARSRSRR